MFIKICANTNLSDAQLAAELGADAVGFVFAPSKRQVNAQQVAAITPQLPGDLLTVGVFATTDAKEIITAVRASGLRGVQIHSAPDAALVEELNCAFEGHVQLIQTIPYSVDAADRSTADAAFEAALSSALRFPALFGVLLDAAKGTASGGLGLAFDWPHAAELVSRVYAAAANERPELPRLIVAGGLNPANVSVAIDTLAPWGVDVASGVEASPGRKDPEKLRAFIAAARQNER